MFLVAFAAGPKATSSRSARYNLGSAQRSKVGVVLTSGFHTQVGRGLSHHWVATSLFIIYVRVHAC